MDRLFYLYLAGCIFWVGLWLATGWLLKRLHHAESVLRSYESHDES